MLAKLRLNLFLALALCISAVVFFRSPNSASSFLITPDAVEYAIGGLNFVDRGFYGIVIDGHEYPSRYPPWFSVCFLSPAFFVLGNEIGNAILPVTIFGVAGVGMAFLIGKELGGNAGGAIASMGVTIFPHYCVLARQIMTDVPCTFFVLAQCYLYLKMQTKNHSRSALAWCCAGLLVAMSLSLRSLFAFTWLPFAWLAVKNANAGYRKAILLSLPPIAVVVAQLVFNQIVFGSPLRSGYNYWCSVPYDFSSKVFSISFLGPNLISLLRSGIPIITLSWPYLIYLVCKYRSDTSTKKLFVLLLQFSLFGLLPITLIHLIYFFQDSRFFLQLASLSIVITGGLLGRILSNVPLRFLAVLQLFILSFAVAYRLVTYAPESPDRDTIEKIKQVVPKGSVLISSIDPVYLYYYLGSQEIRIVPTSRNVEYASKMICQESVSHVPWNEEWDGHIVAELQAEGCFLPVEVTLSEDFNMIVDAFKDQKRVFIERSRLSADDQPLFQELASRFSLLEIDANLYEVTSRKSNLSKVGG